MLVPSLQHTYFLQFHCDYHSGSTSSFLYNFYLETAGPLFLTSFSSLSSFSSWRSLHQFHVITSPTPLSVTPISILIFFGALETCSGSSGDHVGDDNDSLTAHVAHHTTCTAPTTMPCEGTPLSKRP